MEKRVLTPEIREALLSKVPFSVNARVSYTPKTYRTKKENTEEYVIPVEYQPVFEVRSFTREEIPQVRKVATKGDEVGIREWSRKVVMGWSNMFDAGTMEELDYKVDPTGGCDKDLFSTIPETVSADILMYASSISGLLDKDKLGL